MRRIIALCSVVLMAVVMLGACGGSSSKTGSNSPDTSADTGDNGGNGSDSDIAALYADADKQKFKITFVNESGDETTYAQDGNGNSSYTNGDSQIFTSSDGTVSCDKDSSGKYTCLSVAQGVGGNPFFAIYSAGKTYISALSKYGDNSSETIAGRDAECVTFSAKSIADNAPGALAAIASAIKGSYTYCVDKDTGVLLKFSIKDEDGKETSSFTVTKFGEPEDSDSTPPAAPRT